MLSDWTEQSSYEVKETESVRTGPYQVLWVCSIVFTLVFLWYSSVRTSASIFPVPISLGSFPSDRLPGPALMWWISFHLTIFCFIIFGFYLMVACLFLLYFMFPLYKIYTKYIQGMYSQLHIYNKIHVCCMYTYILMFI